MAIRIIDGVPGSGKTYYVVNHLIEKYKEKLNDVMIYTNIDSLVLPHIDIEEEVRKKSVNTVFNIEYFKKEIEVTKEKQLILIVDEAQRYFHRKFYDNEVFYFFQYHRHLGLDVYLITQNEKLLPIQLTTMSECLIHAQPRSVSLIGEMKYVVKVSGEPVERIVLRPNQQIFDLYKSMKKLEGEKPKSVFRRYLVWMIALIIIIPVVFFYTFLYHPKKKQEQNGNANQKTEIQKQIGFKVEEKKSVYEENNDTMAYQCGYVTVGNDLMVEDPITCEMVRAAQYRYPLKIINLGRFLSITGYFPKEKLEKIIEKRELEAAKLEARASQASLASGLAAPLPR